MPTARSKPELVTAFDDRQPERVGDAEERDHDGEEEEHVDQVQELVDLRGLRRLVLVAGLHLGPRELVHHLLDRRGVRRSDAALRVFTYTWKSNWSRKFLS